MMKSVAYMPSISEDPIKIKEHVEEYIPLQGLIVI